MSNRIVFGAAATLLIASVSEGFVTKKPSSPLESRVVVLEAGYIPGEIRAFEEVAPNELENRSAFVDFRQRYGGSWNFHVDATTGRPASIGGGAHPMIPGDANGLTMADIPRTSEGPRRTPTVSDVDALVRRFIQDNYPLFRLDDRDLLLVPESGFFGNRSYICEITYQIVHDGVPVEGAFFGVTINNGNLVSAGFSANTTPPRMTGRATVPKARAEEALSSHVGGLFASDARLVDGVLKFVPYDLGQGRAFGDRVGHHLIWEYRFNRPGDHGSWLAWIDAHSGRILRFEDVASYATYKRIRGQVYPEHIGGGSTLQARSFAYAREDTQAVYASLGGLYSYPGGNATSTLQGRYAFVLEACATKPNLTAATGDLNFGGTTSQDCAYTGAAFGNATEAGLMGLYHVMQQKVTALTYLPANTWLNAGLRFEANANSQCNANWDGTDLSMFRSGATGGAPCNNSGLVAGIFQHEFGHGMDSNDGRASSDQGTGEVYADTCAIIQTHNSCIGDYFWASNRACGPNAGYGNACNDCGGVRDIDYAAKQRNTPSTVQNFVCTDCWSTSYQDPCGMEGHCSAHAMGEALWDLAARDLPASGKDANTSWERFARIFYMSANANRGPMYTCSCNGGGTSSGCAADNWYQRFLVHDDTGDGICNGTPNSAAIYAAFARHNIACANTAGCTQNVSSTTCPTIAAPTLANPTAGACTLTLSWGSVANAAEYRIYRNESGCTKGFTQIGIVTAPTTSYIDSDVSPTVTYYYSVQGVGTNEACSGNMSTCRSGVPNDCTTCVIPTQTVGTPGCAGGSSSITVSWTNTTTGDGYRVYRQKEGEFTWVNVSGDLGLVNSYVDTSVLCSATPGQNRYRYKIRSYENTNGPCESADSALSAYCEASCGCTIPAAPGAPTFSSVACATLTVNWTAIAGATSYDVYRRTGACGAGTLQGNVATNSYNATGLAAGTQYSFYVVAKNACGNSADGTCASVTTLTTPAAPAAPTYSSVTCSTLTVNWTAVAGAATYDVVRRAGACGGGGTSIVGADVAGTSFNDTGLTGSTQYSYYVIAKNACGSSANGTCSSVTTTGVPAAPTGVSATGACANVQVAWTGSAGASSYNVVRGTTCGTAVTTFTGVTSPYDDTTAVAGTTYNYWVVAVNSCGTSANSTCATGTRTAIPAAPTGVSATPSCTANSVAWTASAGATSYNVVRGTTCGTAVTTFTGVSSPYPDTTAVAGTLYNYWVVAVNACGTSANSSCATAARTSVPAAPTGVSATGSCANVQVAWTASAGATSYNVVRGTTCGTAVTTFTGVGSPYDDTTAVAGTTYNYWVVAVNACGNSANSSCATGTRLATPAAPAAPSFSAVSCNTLTVNWTAVPGAATYDVLRRTGGCAGGGTAVVGADVVGTSFADSGLAASTGYSYFVVAKNACGASANGACGSVTTTGVPAAPAAPNFSGTTCTATTVSWSAVAGATTYDVYRRSGNCGAGTAVATDVAGTSFGDTGLTAGSQYSYYVVAKNSCGSSPNGTCASVTTSSPLAAPTGLATNGTCSAVDVSWDAVPGASTYNVLRGATCGAVAVVASGVAGTAWTDVTAAVGTTYQYAVEGVDACGAGTRSACVPGLRPGCPDLVYTTGSFAVSQQQGDGSATVMSPGEKWRLAFTVTNVGTGGTTSAELTVTANNGVAGGDFCDNPVAVGDVAASATSGALSVDFIVPASWAGVCVSDVQFGFTQKVHAGALPAGNDEAAGSPSVAEVKKQVGVATGGTPTGLTLDSAGDAFVKQGQAGTNYGSLTYLRAGRDQNGGNGNNRSLLQFDLSSIPAGSTINSATLELTATVADVARTHNVLGLTGPWAEGTVTFGSQPANDATIHGTISTGTGTGTKTSSSLVALVQTWVDGSFANNGVYVQDSTESNGILWEYASKEDTTAANRPRLVLNYTPPGGSDCTAWGGTPSCSGASMPPPVPDGTAVTNPLAATKAGASVAVTWDSSSCAASDYNLYWAPIGQYTSFSGGVCAVGTAFTGAIPDDVWFAVGGTNTAGVVSSITRQSDGSENPTTGWGAVCAAQATRDTSVSCP